MISVLLMFLAATIFVMLAQLATNPFHRYISEDTGSVVVNEEYAWRNFNALVDRILGTQKEAIPDLKIPIDPPGITTVGGLGLNSMMGRLDTIYLDRYCLADPLRARLPAALRLRNLEGLVDPTVGFRPGHIQREYPAGYIVSIDNGRNMIPIPHIAALYDDVLLLTQGQLFTKERAHAILRQMMR